MRSCILLQVFGQVQLSHSCLDSLHCDRCTQLLHCLLLIAYELDVNSTNFTALHSTGHL